MQGEDTDPRTALLERRVTVLELAVQGWHGIVGRIEARVGKLELRVFSAGFSGSAFGAGLVVGALYALKKFFPGVF